MDIHPTAWYFVRDTYAEEGDRVAMPFTFCFLELNEII
jgi:hypothetical protein